MRCTVALLALGLAACASESRPPLQAAAWRNSDGTPVSPDRFARARAVCEEAEASARRSAPPADTGVYIDPGHLNSRSLVPVPPIDVTGSGSTTPSPATTPAQPPFSIERCLEAQGFIPAR